MFYFLITLIVQLVQGTFILFAGIKGADYEVEL